MFAGISGNQPSQQGLFMSFTIVVLTKGRKDFIGNEFKQIS